MFDIGDAVVYALHGACRIDDIGPRDVDGTTKLYYTLHPICEDTKITIHAPAMSEKVSIRPVIPKSQAEDILRSFSVDDAGWIEDKNARSERNISALKSGNPFELSMMVKAILRRQAEAKIQRKSISALDSKALVSGQKLLFSELAVALDRSMDQVRNAVLQEVQEDPAEGN